MPHRRESQNSYVDELKQDFSLFNVLQGITVQEVEKAVRGEDLIIRGKRRRGIILDSDDEAETEQEPKDESKAAKLDKTTGQIPLTLNLGQPTKILQRKPSFVDRVLQWKKRLNIFTLDLSESKVNVNNQTIGNSLSLHQTPNPQPPLCNAVHRTEGQVNLHRLGQLQKVLISWDKNNNDGDTPFDDIKESVVTDHQTESTIEKNPGDSLDQSSKVELKTNPPVLYRTEGKLDLQREFVSSQVRTQPANYRVGLVTIQSTYPEGANHRYGYGRAISNYQEPRNIWQEWIETGDTAPLRNDQQAPEIVSEIETVEAIEEEEKPSMSETDSEVTDSETGKAVSQKRTKPKRVVSKQRRRRKAGKTRIFAKLIPDPKPIVPSDISESSFASTMQNVGSTNPPSLASDEEEVTTDIPISNIDWSTTASTMTVDSVKPSIMSSIRSFMGQLFSRKNSEKSLASEHSDFFRNSEILSQSASDKDSHNNVPNERDKEWLQYTEDEKVDEEKEKLDNFLEKLPQDDCAKMMSRIRPLYTLMKYTGRMPAEIVRQKKSPKCEIFRLNRSSKNFKIFCVTSCFLIICCISMIVDLVTIVGRKRPYTFNEDAVALEFDKYYIESALTALCLCFTCICSIGTMFETGIYLTEYLTRWNLCIALLRYDVSDRLKGLLYFGFGCLGVYSIGFIVLFFLGGNDIPTVRGASGFIALSIFGPFLRDFRLHRLYFILEYVGLVVHLYSVICSTLIVLMILVYATALENGARRFNLRLAYALGRIALPNENGVYRTVRRIISYKKLFAEHIVVTSFSRNMGAVFAVPLIAFYSTKMLAMIITLYALLKPLLNGFPQFNETFLNVSKAHGETTVPILYAEPNLVVGCKYMYLTSECWLIFWFCSLIISNTGDAIMNGFEFIRRHSLHSKSSNERRFIVSMQNSFAPTNSYYINPGVKINRDFILSFSGFVLAMFVFLIQFSPERLKTETSIVCNHAGECHRISYSKYWETPAQKAVDQPVTTTSTLPPPTTTSTISTNTIGPEVNSGKIPYAPCKPNGLVPVKMLDYACKCTPEVYTLVPFIKTETGGITRYEGNWPKCCNRTVIEIDKLPPSYQVVDCYGEKVDSKKIDECKRVSLNAPNADGKKVEATLEIAVFNRKSVESQSLLCCWSYADLSDQAIERCNLNTILYAAPQYGVCEKNSSARRRIYEELLWREIRANNFKRPPRIELKKNWNKWIACICQDIPGHALANDDSCKDLGATAKKGNYPPCSKAFDNYAKSMESKRFWGNTRCGWTEFRKLNKVIKQQILYQRDELFRYVPITNSRSDCSTNKYPKDFDLLSKKFPFPIGKVDITDCNGKIQPSTILQSRDECQNLNLKDGSVPELKDMNVVFFEKNDHGLEKNSIFCCYTTDCNLDESSIASRCGGKLFSKDRIKTERIVWDYLAAHGPWNVLTALDKLHVKECVCQYVTNTKGKCPEPKPIRR